MNLKNSNSYYDEQIERIMAEQGMDHGFSAELKRCVSLTDVFEVLSAKEAKHVALLSSDQEPITDIFLHIKLRLAAKKSVLLALFFELDRFPVYQA